MLDFDDLALEEGPRTPRTKAGLDSEVFELAYERRLSMAARRAADLFDLVSMFSTASLLRALAVAADFEVSAAKRVPGGRSRVALVPVPPLQPPA